VPDTAFYALAVNFKADHSQLGADAFGLAWSLPDSPFLEGDANLDGRVDLNDFGALKAHFGEGNLLSQGDFDLDRDVDLDDFGLLKANFGHTAGTVAVPEPPGGVLFAVGILLFSGLLGAPIISLRPITSGRTLPVAQTSQSLAVNCQ
jgi:hypothetical protein